MSDDKLKQKHVFVKNNVGSLALHKAKQEIGGIKMDSITKNCTNCLKLLGFHYDRVNGRFCSEKCRDEFFNKLQGRDDLNSNKTPKEFCKDKERN